MSPSEPVQPLGPEDQERPDRDAQTHRVGAEHERAPKNEDDEASDADGGAWRTEATFDGHEEAPKGDADEENDGVDPIVHRGE
jgi:hypothetical protein